MRTKFIDSPDFIDRITAIEVISVIVISFMKMSASIDGGGDGWIPYSVIDVPKLFIFMVANGIMVRSLFRDIKSKESPTKTDKINYTIVLCIFMGILLILHPIYWLPDFSASRTPQEVIPRDPSEYSEKYKELYNMFVEELEQADFQDLSAVTWDYERGDLFSDRREFEITEDLHRKITDILQDVSPQPYALLGSDKAFNRGGDIELEIELESGSNFYSCEFSYDYENLSKEFGVEGKTRLKIYSWENGKGEYIIDNSYINRIIDILPGYKLDHTVRNQFLEDIKNAKAENFSISAVVDGNTYSFVIEQDSLDKMISHFTNRKLHYEWLFEERGGEFPEGDVSVSFTMSEFDTTVDIVYVHPDDEKARASTELFHDKGETFMRISARGETRYFEANDMMIIMILQQVGLYE